MPAYECAYCGQVADATDDHVPPKSFFTGVLDSTLPSVKACAECNGGGSLDDEYFRDTVVSYHGVEGRPQALALIGKMLRATQNPKKASYAKAFRDSIVEVDVVTPGGLSMGKRPALVIDQANGQEELTDAAIDALFVVVPAKK